VWTGGGGAGAVNINTARVCKRLCTHLRVFPWAPRGSSAAAAAPAPAPAPRSQPPLRLPQPRYRPRPWVRICTWGSPACTTRSPAPGGSRGPRTRQASKCTLPWWQWACPPRTSPRADPAPRPGRERLGRVVSCTPTALLPRGSTLQGQTLSENCPDWMYCCSVGPPTGLQEGTGEDGLLE